jgi:hypothetical protein
MKFLNRTVAMVGSTWGILDALLIVVPLYLYGTSLTSTSESTSILSSPRFLFTGYDIGPLPVFPVGWFVLAVSFISAFAIADMREAVKALGLSEIIAFAVSPLVLISFPSAKTFPSPDGMIAFFSFVAVAFFLLGMVGAVFGSFLGMWLGEQPDRLTVSLSRHRAFLLAAILVLAIGTSSLLVGSLVTAQLQSAANAANSTRSVTAVVTSQTLNWSLGVENVRADFVKSNSSNPGGGDRITIEWSSSINVTFHVMLQAAPVYGEESLHSCGGILYANQCDFSCGGTYCGRGTLDLGSSPTFFSGDTGYTAAWFHNDECSVSGCPSGLLHYEIWMTYF